MVPLPKEEFQCFLRTNCQGHAAYKENVSHRDETPIEKEQDAEDCEDDAERCQADANFCV